MNDRTEALLQHFRDSFARDPVAAFRDWYRAQEDLRDSQDAATARALADDLWNVVPALGLGSSESRARFLHNLAVFFGSRGPAESLPRAREAFSESLALFSGVGDAGWEARVLHNFATSLSNLGQTARDLEESVALFDRALAWRTAEREIARGVTLHNLGLALRRLAELDPAGACGRLGASERALSEACAIRARHGLDEGRARSLFHRGITLRRLSEAAGRGAAGNSAATAAATAAQDARTCLEEAAREFERLGKPDSASTARGLLAPDPETP